MVTHVVFFGDCLSAFTDTYAITMPDRFSLSYRQKLMTKRQILILFHPQAHHRQIVVGISPVAMAFHLCGQGLNDLTG